MSAFSLARRRDLVGDYFTNFLVFAVDFLISRGVCINAFLDSMLITSRPLTRVVRGNTSWVFVVFSNTCRYSCFRCTRWRTRLFRSLAGIGTWCRWTNATWPGERRLILTRNNGSRARSLKRISIHSHLLGAKNNTWSFVKFVALLIETTEPYYSWANQYVSICK